MVPIEQVRIHVEEEMPAARAWATRRRVNLEWHPGLVEIRVTLVQRETNDVFYLRGRFDGYRALAACAGNDVRVYTRKGLDWSDKFAPLVERLRALDLPPCLIDGEIVAYDRAGNPDFSSLQGVLKRGHGSQKDSDRPPPTCSVPRLPWQGRW